MSFVARNKLSAPPPPRPTDSDRAALLSLTYHAGFPALIDILHREAIRAELEVYTAQGSHLSDPELLQRVREARIFWLCLDAVQGEIAATLARQEENDGEPEAADDAEVTNFSNDALLNP